MGDNTRMYTFKFSGMGLSQDQWPAAVSYLNNQRQLSVQEISAADVGDCIDITLRALDGRSFGPAAASSAEGAIRTTVFTALQDYKRTLTLQVLQNG